jgi:hypothetical protein
MTQTNGVSYAELTDTAKQLGAQAGQGKDTQVKMLMKLVEGGYHNGVDMNPNKYGPGMDDATKLAEVYVQAQGSASVFDAKAANQRKLISCFRTSIRLGQWPKGGQGEPLATMNRLMTMRQNKRKNPAVAKQLDDAANTLMKYARAQIRRDTLIEDAELEEMCLRKSGELKTPMEILEATRKNLLRLKHGKAANGTAQDQSPEVLAAIQSLTDRIKTIASENRVGSTPTSPPSTTV